jgi:hypothetical protein
MRLRGDDAHKPRKNSATESASAEKKNAEPCGIFAIDLREPSYKNGIFRRATEPGYSGADQEEELSGGKGNQRRTKSGKQQANNGDMKGGKTFEEERGKSTAQNHEAVENESGAGKGGCVQVRQAGTVLRDPAAYADLGSNVEKEEKKKGNRGSLAKTIEPIRKRVPS